MTSATTESLTLFQLESHLWEAANILRGSPADRTDWRSYILPLLFFKRIYDVWDEEHAPMVAVRSWAHQKVKVNSGESVGGFND
jgi:type I restriction-modification system DNA methylase subunit